MSLPKLPETPALPTLPVLPAPPWEQEPTLLPKTPGIAGGIVTAPDKGWCLVEYADIATKQKTRFIAKPIVIALAEVRFGDLAPVTAPTIIVPSITLPKLSEIIRVTRDDFNSVYYCDLVAGKARDKVHELDLGILLNPVKTIIADTLIYWSFFAAMFGIGFIINVLWDSFFQPQIDNVQNEMDAISADFREKVQSTINTFGTEVQTRVNQGLSDVIPILYAIMGFAEGQLITTVNTRNITTTSFQYSALSRGQKTHYIAVGLP